MFKYAPGSLLSTTWNPARSVSFLPYFLSTLLNASISLHDITNCSPTSRQDTRMTSLPSPPPELGLRPNLQPHPNHHPPFPQSKRTMLNDELSAWHDYRDRCWEWRWREGWARRMFGSHCVAESRIRGKINPLIHRSPYTQGDVFGIYDSSCKSFYS